MLKEIADPRGKPSEASDLPRSVLYSISARIGGSGLDTDCFESLRGLHRAKILGRAVAYANRQSEIPRSLIQSLRGHPARIFLSFLPREYFYGAKKHYLDRVACKDISTGRYDLFHAWSGECVRTLREARRRNIPSVLEIPTWHRNKGKQKPARTKSEVERDDEERLSQRWLNSFLVSRQQALEEYELADLLLVLSQRARETFLAAGIPESKLFDLPRGVDPERFTPGTPPEIFRAVFVGALIKRKGVHTLLEVWDRLKLKDAELVLVGAVHDEIKPYLKQFAKENVRLAGFTMETQEHYRRASVHVFPSTCEGSAKVTYEAAACGLPQISTRESGDVVIDGVNGLVVPCEDPDALAAAIERLYRNPDLRAAMGAAARKRIVENLTWDHFRARLLDAYRAVWKSK